eukprot:TRINITY_DN3563_c0_g1_i1.p1 TRINITY_DN3563_c0_g1~~TRINITY_DN3563_c0_g1_i1.p1  ORF type:complete len:240 (-),score=100.73 TRINITY_DN3563_c0_g1_i1:91-768(-)
MPQKPSEYYLFAYNTAQFFGWSYILVLTLVHLANGHGFDTVWDTVHIPLLIFQNAAILEVIHPLLKLVRTPVSTTAVQVASRLFLASVICIFFPEVRASFFFTSMVISWCLSEMVRYSFYSLNIFNACPKFLVWLRYTLFMILYPTGAGSEFALVILSIPIAHESGIFSITMPNALNFGFSFEFLLYAIALSYLPGLPMMYGHMLSQRKKVLGAKPATPVEKKQQ